MPETSPLSPSNSCPTRRAAPRWQDGDAVAGTEFERRTIVAEVPLSELVKYATVLRSMTQGGADFTMEFQDYQFSQ